MQTYRLLRIDELNRADHRYLTPDDDCAYLMEYVPDVTNEVKSVILNYKKGLDRKGLPEFQYKDRTIHQVAQLLRTALPPFTSPDTILVPIPPSQTRDHPHYDDRHWKMLNIFRRGRDHCDIRDLLSVRNNMPASHGAQRRPSPEEIFQNLMLDKDLCNPPKPNIILVDDVITTGSHFKACKRLLKTAFPLANISGLFIARRAFV